MSRRKKRIIIFVSLIILIAIGVFVTIVLLTHKVSMNAGSQNIPPLINATSLDTLPRKDASGADTTRVAASIISPTNSWLSGMVLQETPLPVYPMPLSFLAKDTGFEVGLPSISSSATAILGEHVPGISVVLPGATAFTLTRYDKISATLTYRNETKPIGNVTLSEGSPYVFFRASQQTSLKIDNVSSVRDMSSHYARYENESHDYVISTDSNATISQNGSELTISAKSNSLTTLYALPGSGTDALRQWAGNELQKVSYSDSTDSSAASTTFDYSTVNGKPTVIVPMNYSEITNPSRKVMTYDSVYGPMDGYLGNKISMTAPIVHQSDHLDISRLSSLHKDQLIDDLKKDAASTAVTADDSYYAGKQLARAANLLDISEQLKQSDMSAHLLSILNEAFSKRLNGQYFYYDTTLKGIAAQTNAFGSQDFNDHHFHYGYFIYAASILAKYDPQFLQKYQNQVNLLVADIASYSSSSYFPEDRYYDPYASHSWAAGLAPFADGNNQESSSEAVNAWNAVALWADTIHNDTLKNNAVWMLSNEQMTASKAWRSFSNNAPYLSSFTSPLTSLNFGGKRTYSTFFSDEPNAKLGIQLIPMNPMMMQDASDGAHINTVVNASIQNDDYNVALGDYILMYTALTDPQEASSLLSKQTDSFIDDGDSRTYLSAWIFSLTDK